MNFLGEGQPSILVGKMEVEHYILHFSDETNRIMYKSLFCSAYFLDKLING